MLRISARFLVGNSAWREGVRMKIAREMERQKLEDSMPKRVVVEDLGLAVISHDLSPTRQAEMLDEELERQQEQQQYPDGEFNDDDEEERQRLNRLGLKSRPTNVLDGDVTLGTHSDATDAFEHRKRLVETAKEKRAARAEQRARWLMWQATQREKGFEQRVRRNLEKQASRQRLRYSAVEGRWLSVGAGSASDFVRQDEVFAAQSRQAEERHSVKSSAATSFAHDDAEFDDMLMLQNPAWHSQKRRAIAGESSNKSSCQNRSEAEIWGFPRSP